MKREIISGVYSIKNVANGKMYVGSSVDIHRRFLQHKRKLNKNIHITKPLQNDWNEYGEENFVFNIIERDIDNDNLPTVEKYYINKYSTLYPNGYNMVFPISDSPCNRYTTDKESIQSLVSRGEHHWNNTNSEDKIIELIDDLITGEYSYNQLSVKYNMTYHIVVSVAEHKRWTYLTDDIVFPKPKVEFRENVKLTENDVREIINLMLDGKSNADISETYNVATHTISDIRRHKTWTYLTKDIEFPSGRLKKQDKKVNHEVVKELSESGMSLKDIAELLSISKSYASALKKL